MVEEVAVELMKMVSSNEGKSRYELVKIGWASRVSPPLGQKSGHLDRKSARLDDPGSQSSLKLKS